MLDNTTSITEREDRTAPLQKQGWSELGLHIYIKILIIGGLFYYLFRIEIFTIVHRWLNDSSWSHGFLIPLFSLYFISQKKEDIFQSTINNELKPNYLGLFFLICGIIFLRYYFLFFIFWHFRNSSTWSGCITFRRLAFSQIYLAADSFSCLCRAITTETLCFVDNAYAKTCYYCSKCITKLSPPDGNYSQRCDNRCVL